MGLLSQSTEVLSISLDFMGVLGDPIGFWEQRSADLMSWQPRPTLGGLTGNLRLLRPPAARCAASPGAVLPSSCQLPLTTKHSPSLQSFL